MTTTTLQPVRLTEAMKDRVREAADALYGDLPLWETSCGVIRASYQAQLEEDTPWRQWLAATLFHAVLLADAGDDAPLARIEEEVLPTVLGTRLLPVRLAAFVEEAVSAQLAGEPGHRRYLEATFAFTGQLV